MTEKISIQKKKKLLKKEQILKTKTTKILQCREGTSELFMRYMFLEMKPNFEINFFFSNTKIMNLIRFQKRLFSTASSTSSAIPNLTQTIAMANKSSDKVERDWFPVNSFLKTKYLQAGNSYFIFNF